MYFCQGQLVPIYQIRKTFVQELNMTTLSVQDFAIWDTCEACSNTIIPQRPYWNNLAYLSLYI